MKKITSFLMMVVLCCVSAYAQEVEVVETELPKNKLVTIGTAQAEMVPGKWYFLQNPRDGQNDRHEYFAIPGDKPVRGGLAEDRGTYIGLSPKTVLDDAMNEEGVSSEAFKKYMVRFVPVEGEDGAYNIQFGTGNWFGDGDPKTTATINQNQYIGGLAGKFNFYLVKNAEGQPNTAGRFGWNKFDMADRVDNNGQGNNVCFWNSGELTLESLDWNQVETQGDAGIIGNNVWQIYDIMVIGELNVFEDALQSLLDDYNTITEQSEGAIIEKLQAGENVGNKPGNYRPEDVNAFLAINQTVFDLLDLWELELIDAVMEQYSVEDIEKLNEDYVAAWNHMINNKVPRAMAGIEPGYYTINSCLFWYTTKNDSVFYTQEEADSINNALVEEGYTEEDSMFVAAGGFKEMVSSQVPATIKSLMAKSSTTSDGTPGQWMAYGPLAPEAKFLWKIEAVPGKPTEYRLLSALNGKTFVGISKSTINGQLVYNDTATVCFDWRNDKEPIKYTNAEGVEVEDTVVSFTLRSSKHAENDYNYLHCSEHGGGAGNQNWCVGWTDGGATRWYLAPVDEATADMWINGPEAQLRAKIEKGDSIADAFPAQLEVAKDLVANVDTTKSVANIETFSSPYHCPVEGNMEHLFDGTYNNASNFWHSNWQSGNGYGFSTQNGSNYFVVEDVNSDINGGLAIMVARRPVANDHLTQLTVYGTNDAYDAAADLERVLAGEDDTNTWTELGVLNTPYGNGSEYITSNAIEFEGQFKYYKFVATATTNNRGYFHMGEFRLFPATITKRYETTQYDARQTQADALAAAIAVWEEKAFAADSLELLEDETFPAAYDALVAAAEAWGKVYVNPTALRQAIAAAPGENLFVIGNNPGQWQEGVVTPGATVAAAEAYNASGAYTPAESEAHIAAIAKAEADVWAAANKIQTGKWYRFNFPSEEMYETYGWDKTGAQASLSHEIEASPALFGKTIAVGKGLTTYVSYEDEEGNVGEVGAKTVEATEEWYDGDQLYYHGEAEFTDGEDLFQFIQATDSTYIIQNKATGLFVRGGSPVTLSAIPTYFYANQAIGAGANVIGWTNIFGEHQQSYLHGQRSDNAMVTWNASTLGSNSMIMIEEVEDVTEAPTNEYTKKMWPGKVYTYTMPVDVKVVDGATAYGAELVIAEETTIVLKAIEAETISAGTPFIAIANLDGEYISTTDRLKAIKAEIEAEDGELSKNDEVLANTQLNDEYALVEMEHGMEVDTVLHELLGLRGTMKQVTVEAGKAIVANENGFKHTLVNTNVAAHSAYLVSDFDPESTDVLNALVISIEGSIETGITEVLDKVAKSGNIYNAAGQLVGKGNINTVNNLPAGIYIVNGVKVTKK